MTEEQRRAWAEYFRDQGINYKFFSAHLAKEMNEGRDAQEELDARQLQQQTSRSVPEKTMTENLQDLNLKDEEGEEWTDEDEDEDEKEAESEGDEEDPDNQEASQTLYFKAFTLLLHHLTLVSSRSTNWNRSSSKT